MWLLDQNIGVAMRVDLVQAEHSNLHVMPLDLPLYCQLVVDLLHLLNWDLLDRAQQSCALLDRQTHPKSITMHGVTLDGSEFISDLVLDNKRLVNDLHLFPLV